MFSPHVELQSKCETLIKDRDAVQTILEHKIKVLVQSVAQGANAVVNSSPGVSSSGVGLALAKVDPSLHCLLTDKANCICRMLLPCRGW